MSAEYEATLEKLTVNELLNEKIRLCKEAAEIRDRFDLVVSELCTRPKEES